MEAAIPPRATDTPPAPRRPRVAPGDHRRRGGQHDPRRRRLAGRRDHPHLGPVGRLRACGRYRDPAGRHRARGRGAWILVAIGLSLYGTGNLLWALWLEHVESPPIPSICDVLWLSLYPASYAGLVLLARGQRQRHARGRLAGRHHRRARNRGVGRGDRGRARCSTPRPAARSRWPRTSPIRVADLLLAALVTGILALRGWRLNGRWLLLGGGFLVLCVADILYLLHVAGGATARSRACPISSTWRASRCSLGRVADAVPRSRPGSRAGRCCWSPARFVLTALGLMVYDHFDRLDPLAARLPSSPSSRRWSARRSASATCAPWLRRAARPRPTT